MRNVARDSGDGNAYDIGNEDNGRHLFEVCLVADRDKLVESAFMKVERMVSLNTPICYRLFVPR